MYSVMTIVNNVFSNLLSSDLKCFHHKNNEYSNYLVSGNNFTMYAYIKLYCIP